MLLSGSLRMVVKSKVNLPSITTANGVEVMAGGELGVLLPVQGWFVEVTVTASEAGDRQLALEPTRSVNEPAAVTVMPWVVCPPDHW